MGNTTGKGLDGIVIRPAVEADADMIGVLWEKLVEHHHQLDRDLPQAAQDGGEIYSQHIRGQIHNPYSQTLVAEADGRVIGYVLGIIVHETPDMFQHDPSGFLADIFVEAAYRSCGVGRQLVDALQDWFKSRGVSYMEWYVAAQNIAAKSFWLAMGGREIMIRMQVKL